MRYQNIVENTQSGEVLATNTNVGFNGGWAEKFLATFSDAGGGGVAWCSNAPTSAVVSHREVISSVLKR